MDKLINSIIMLVLTPLIKKYLEGKITSDQIVLLLRKLFEYFITPENVAKCIDGLLDKIEDYVKNTDNKYDDKIVAIIRQLSGVEDNDIEAPKPN